MVQLYNRIKEEREYHISNLDPPMYPSVEGHHYQGPLPGNILSESVSQCSTVILENFTIRVQNSKRRSSKKDDCFIMASNKVCLVKNIVNRNGEIYLVCLTFKSTIPLYDSPLPSTSIGMYQIILIIIYIL